MVVRKKKNQLQKQMKAYHNMYVDQIITLCILNLHNVKCLLYLDKSGKKTS